jgi:hypothetical protein
MALISFSRRHRDRHGAGKSDRSYIKHEFVEKIVASQVNAYRVSHPNHKVVLFDGNAGDGEGVLIDTYQEDMFVGEILSHPTPEILTDIAAQVGNVDVVLCEKVYAKRVKLYSRFPTAQIVGHHREAPSVLRPDHHYALWLSDPVGPRDHGVEHMCKVAAKVAADFVIILNEGACRRINGTTSTGASETMRDLYSAHIDPQWWRETLGKRYVARTMQIGASNAFRFRIMVVADDLANSCVRYPFVEIYNCNGMARASKEALACLPN